MDGMQWVRESWLDTLAHTRDWFESRDGKEDMKMAARTPTEADKKLAQIWRRVSRTDPKLVRLWRAWSSRVWGDDLENAFLDFMGNYEWTITRFGHTFTAKPSGYILQIVNSLEPILYIKVHEDGAQLEISAELSQFTRVQEQSK